MHSDSTHAHDTANHFTKAIQITNRVIDTVYEHVIRITVFIVTRFREQMNVTPSLHEEEHEVEEVAMVVSEKELPAFRTVQQVLEKTAEEKITHSLVGKNTLVYIAGVSVPVYKNPTMEFDTQIGTIPYGEMAMMLEPRGRFLKIVWNALEGWVLREDVVDRAAHIYPEFIVGEENSVDNPNTAHVRAILGDVFGIGHSEFALQAGEYVLYKLWRRNIRVEWPPVRPRVPGLWHKILRGTPHVQMSVTPKVGSVMEYMLTNDMGHLAYVEAVFPDNTIAISEANYPDGGVYSERQLTKEEWKELRPVFIQMQ